MHAASLVGNLAPRPLVLLLLVPGIIGIGNLNDSTIVTNTSHTVTYSIPERYTVIGQGSFGWATVIDGSSGFVAAAPRYRCNCVLPVPGSPRSPSYLKDIRKSTSNPDPEPDWRNGMMDTPGST
ncbi:hypothetical protein D9758_017099 [Tetrapyrgos nigripes]|uniref:Uncharacterized protein n=1 Tax=Tetrapyrgos nigripes TaxID=182062 RepID=A0A8H5C2F7_9AGAR|nr:hypothetical protein D9758_017099 [Tetrapyrgos nigripes]